MPWRGKRPTPAQIDTVLEALRGGNTRKVAALANLITEAQLKTWLSNIPTFKAAVEQAEAQAEMALVSTLYESGTTGRRWQSAVTWLSRRRPMDWAEIQRFEVYQKIEEIKELQDELARENIHVPMQQLLNDYQKLTAPAPGKRAKLKALPPPQEQTP